MNHMLSSHLIVKSGKDCSGAPGSTIYLKPLDTKRFAQLDRRVIMVDTKKAG